MDSSVIAVRPIESYRVVALSPVTTRTNRAELDDTLAEAPIALRAVSGIRRVSAGQAPSKLIIVPAIPVDPMADTFAYVQVAADIERRIRIGEITVRLPSERSLADEYECSYLTVRHATSLLRDRGLIVTRQGRGTYVARQPE
jgi:GntR family transcriptional regulator